MTDRVIKNQCTAHSKQTGKRCKRPGAIILDAQDGSVARATVCKWHGAGAPQVRRKALENLALGSARRAIKASGYLKDVDPLDALDELLAEAVALKGRLRNVVDRLEDDSLRYDGRAGEQIRGELQAYMSSMRDVSKFAETIVRLGISERRQKLAEAQAFMVAGVIKAILNRLELNHEQQALAVHVVPEELRAISAIPSAEPVPAE